MNIWALIAMVIAAVVCVYVITSLFFLKYPHILHEKKKLAFRCLHISHRGGAGENLENTIPAFKHAVELGTDMLELDCHITKDEEVVVSHDDNLYRVTGEKMNVSETLYDELPPLRRDQRLDFKPSFNIHSNQEDVKIPLLKEVFESFHNVAINIDIKIDNDLLIQKVNQLTMEHNRVHLTVWGSKSNVVTKKCYKENKDIPIFFTINRTIKLIILFYTGLLPFIPLKESLFEIPMLSVLMRQFNFSKKIKFVLRIVNCLLMSPVLFHHLHKRGIQTYLWVLNDEEEFNEAYLMGATGVMTDFPLKLKSFIEKHPELSKSHSLLG